MDEIVGAPTQTSFLAHSVPLSLILTQSAALVLLPFAEAETVLPVPVRERFEL